jgi:serine/threonine protein kinase/tetratricopeptide (TPR) repeat protein
MSESTSGGGNEPPPPTPAQRLWQLWRQGQRPDVLAFLAGAGELTPAERAAALLVDQRERWQAGERRPAEAYLEMYPQLRGNFEYGLELVYGEYLLCEWLGESPNLDAYCGRFPEYARRLKLQVELHQAFGATRLTGPDPVEPGQTPTGDAPPLGDPGWPAPPSYEVLEELGKGGMGVVYKARQKGLNRLVALKMILAGRHAGAGKLARFRTEAEAIARLQHPNIVQIFEVGEYQGAPFLALEYCDGGSLEEALAGTPLPPRPAAALLETLARAVHVAHQVGVIHRDLKPGNVLLAFSRDAESSERSGAAEERSAAASRLNNSVPKIADFGLAKKLDEEGVTVTGEGMGTPSYMPPEQAEGKSKEVGPPADVYALGAILYEMLTGRPPFTGASVQEVLDQVRRQDPVRPTRLRPGVPIDLETICLHCLRKEPGRRYPTALELADDLRRFLEDRPIGVRPPGPAERFGKFARRNRALVGGTAAVFLALLLGVVSTAAGWVNAVAARGRAQEAEGKAREDRDRALAAEERARELLVASNEHAAQRSMALGDWQSALEHLDRALRVGKGEEVRLRLARVKAHCALHQLPRALREIEALSRRADLGALEGSVLLWRADIDLARLLDDGEALKKVRQARALQLPDAEREYADGLLAGTVGQAIGHFKSALVHDRLHHRATCMLSTLLIIMGRNDEARPHLDFAVLVFPRDPTVKVLYALSETLEDHQDRAAGWLEKARPELNKPELESVRELLAFVSLLRQQLRGDVKANRLKLVAAAARLWGRKMASGQDSALFFPLPPVLSRVMGRLPVLLPQSRLFPDRTIEELRQTVQVLPAGYLYLWLGELLAGKDRLAEAKEAYLNAHEKPSPFPVKIPALVNVVYCEGLLAKQGAPPLRPALRKKTLETLRQFIRLYDVPPEDASNLVNIALAFGELDLARSVVGSWERQKPDVPDVLRTRALVELRSGAYERAIEAAERALLKEPKDKLAARYRSQAQEGLRKAHGRLK